MISHELLRLLTAVARDHPQVIEICIFAINSGGAVLAGFGDALVPYVAITVAMAAVFSSLLEHTRVGKKVEAYNAAQRDLHNMINWWEGMTSTERRTSKSVKIVVTTVEGAMQLVAISHTDAIPFDQMGGGQDGEEGEEKKEE